MPALPTFRSLRTKLTVLYASLLAAILLITSLVTYAAVTGNALRLAERQLTTSGTAFDRVWALRTAQLQNGAGLLSRDFGFREAVATNDAPTIRSALDNLKRRLGIDLAEVVGADGRMTGAGDGLLGTLDPKAMASIEASEGVSGIVLLDHTPYELVSAPVAAPVSMGWVVFATKLDRAQMRSLEDMAAVPLNASILERDHSGAWRTVDGGGPPPGSAAASRFIDRALAARSISPARLTDRDGAATALVKPLLALDPAQSIVLLLRYPMAQAMAGYQMLFAMLAATALAGLCAAVVGARMLASNLTKPILALDFAANRMRQGELTEVTVQTGDEIGRLADSFNRMVATIGRRDAERTRAAEALKRARDQAEAANRAKSSFLANMSHEVRTPLNGVIGVAGVLADSRLDEQQKGMVEIIQTSAGELERVLNDVLDIASGESGRLEIVERAFSLDEAISEVARASEIRCRDKGLRFVLAEDTQPGQLVLGDRARLIQVLDNLLANAVKFTAEGEVTLQTRLVDPSRGIHRFDVRDTGVGFDPAIGETLFTPFQQADGSMTRRFGGSGLGLSISRHLARAMGGELTAKGTPGEGATFTLTLALPDRGEAPARQASGRQQADARREAGPGPVRILLADDHETNRTVVAMILSAIGAELVSVEDGAQAVEAFSSQAFDLVLMDLQMPVMDGFTAIRLIRQHEGELGKPATPILVVSANVTPEHVAAARAAGADGHIGKPVTPAGLIAAVSDALAGPAATARAVA